MFVSDYNSSLSYYTITRSTTSSQIKLIRIKMYASGFISTFFNYIIVSLIISCIISIYMYIYTEYLRIDFMK